MQEVISHSVSKVTVETDGQMDEWTDGCRWLH